MEWHVIRDPKDPELDRLAERYHLHPLHVEDCRHRGQSAKVEENHVYLFAVLKPIALGGDDEIDAADLDIFVGRDFVITVEETDTPHIERLVAQLRSTSGIERPDQALYRLMDGVVDSYVPAIDHFSETIDSLEDMVLERPSPQALARIFATKRALIELRRVLVNTRDVASHLQRSDSPLVGRDLWPFLRDVYDHLARNLDLVEMQRDLLTGSLDIYLSSVANRTNQVMKALTVLSTIALPILLISSIYGMNVKGLPWIDSPHAASIVFLLSAVLTFVLLLLLRIFRWF
jgi:magnesium transporter